jgi:hypothetical protein
MIEGRPQLAIRGNGRSVEIFRKDLTGWPAIAF